ncbi:MAG TPA: hypothetical protein VG839_01080 [Asticcacaulis sp.]|nr:hypothetical protein [Asticcacaulis sp.]
MNQTDKHPHSPRLRDRSDQLIQALEALPAPQTLSDILQHTRALIALDRLLTQLWKAPSTRGAKAEPAAVEDAPETAAPLNRQQRRAQAAQDRAARDRTAKPASPAPWREAG